MEAKKIFDQIISLCYEIDNDRLSSAILPIEDTEGDASVLVNLLEEIMVILYELKGDDSYTDDIIGDIEELHAELYEM